MAAVFHLIGEIRQEKFIKPSAEKKGPLNIRDIWGLDILYDSLGNHLKLTFSKYRQSTTLFMSHFRV